MKAIRAMLVRAGLAAGMPLAIGALAAAACTGSSVDDRVALEEPLRFGYLIGPTAFRAQFVPGAMPAPATGPAVAGVDIGPSEVSPGHQAKGGYVVRLDKSAYTVALRLKGRDNGYWIARVDQPEALFANQVSANIFFDVAASFAPGRYELELSGIDVNGSYGPRRIAPLNVVPRLPPNLPVTIELRWDAAADLDLQLLAPNGNLLGPKRPTTAPLGDAGADAGTPPGEALLDGDSVASCTDDGLRTETAYFRTPPAPGLYKIYVNPFNMCGRVSTTYEVRVSRNGNVEARYFGRISEAEVRQGGFDLGFFITDVTF